MYLDRICRLCLRQTPALVPLFVDNRAQILEILTSITVCQTDQVCLKCLYNLKFAYKIQQDMRRADEKFHEMLLTGRNFEQNSFRIKAPNAGNLVNCVSEKQMMPLCTTDSAHCLICGQYLAANSNSNEHIKGHFQDNRTCSMCNNQTFVSYSDYKQHISHCHQTNLSFKCASCSLTFFYESLYNVHMEKAHSHFTSSLQSNRAQDEASSSDDSSSQLTPVKNSQTQEKCFKSAESTRVARAVRNHIIRANKERRYTCPICNKVFGVYKKYQSHKNNHRRKICPICDKGYTPSNFKKHVENHNAEQQICELCGNTFKNKDGLRTHMFYSHSEYRYKCDRCGQAFSKKCRRDLHIRRDHDDNPTFVCDTCGKKFYSMPQLNLHKKRTHEKLRPYICDFCKKAFSSRNAMNTHRRQHTLEAPYKCDLCFESFRQKISLRLHKKSKHNIIEQITVVCKKCGRGFSSSSALFSHKRAKCN